MKRKLMMVILTYLVIGLVSTKVEGAVFCATTSNELSVALFIAGSNGQSDLIKIQQGNYAAPQNQGFIYGEVDSENYELEISGGWIEFMGNPCGLQLTGQTYSTSLDGNEEELILDMIPNGDSTIKISHLNFINGFQTGPGMNGGGLLIRPEAGASSGSFVIENNTFVNNHSFSSSAVMILQAKEVVFRNNLIISNTGESGLAAVNIQSDDEIGMYITNNTIMFNSSGIFTSNRNSSQAFFANNLLWANTNLEDAYDIHMNGNGTRYFYHNNVGVAVTAYPSNRSGNTSFQPVFEPGILNFTPDVNSPLVGGGINQPVLVPIPTPFRFLWKEGALDIEGNIRNQGNRIDVGAVESPHEMFIEIPIFADGFESM